MSSIDTQAQIWDIKAIKFPKFTLDENATSIKVYNYLKNKGIDFYSKKVLDIGCGSGRYALLFAKDGANVDALDVSSKMLEELNKSAKAHNISNVNCICVNFDEFIKEDRNYEIIFASMTPAIYKKEHIEYMCKNGKTKIYIGWGRKRENPFMSEIFMLHGLEYKPPVRGALMVEEILNELGICYEAYYFFDEWSFEGDINEAKENIIWHITINEATPKIDLIDSFLQKHVKDGKIKHTSKVELGLIIW